MMKLPLFIINKQALKLNSEERKKIEMVNKILGYGMVRNPAPSIENLGFILPTPKGFINLKSGEFLPAEKEAR